MSSPRRRLVRPPPSPAPPASPSRQLLKLRTRLTQERDTLSRWMRRLKRAFHAMEKSQEKVARIERQIARLEE